MKNIKLFSFFILFLAGFLYNERYADKIYNLSNFSSGKVIFLSNLNKIDGENFNELKQYNTENREGIILKNGHYYYKNTYKIQVKNSFSISDLEKEKIKWKNIKNVPEKKAYIENIKIFYFKSQDLYSVELSTYHKLIKATYLYGYKENLINALLLDFYKSFDYFNENDLIALIKTAKIFGKIENKDSRIEGIYKYILKNINYDFDLLKESALIKQQTSKLREKGKIVTIDYNRKFYTSIENGLITFKNKKGICGGISNLFIYMLKLSNIDEKVEYKTGYVLNSYTLLPNIYNLNFDLLVAHAWVKIGDYYYDLTFDLANKYPNYYKIPEDLFYVFRIESNNLSNFKNENRDKSHKTIYNNLIKLANKYNNKDTYSYLLYPIKTLLDKYSESEILSKSILQKKSNNKDLNGKNIFDFSLSSF